MKAQGIPAITVCLLLCLTGCAGRGQTETTSSGESLPAGNAGLLDHEDSRQAPLWQRTNAGETVFYDIYTEEEKAEDPAKEDTGLFFFRGDPGAKFAVCNAGGGFDYVGAMQDSFPHALELSRRGYNAFALIYRLGAQTACEDLARAISFIFEHAEELEVDTDCYSLWGGSAGGRMAVWLGSYGPAAFGGDELPDLGPLSCSIGHSDYTENDPPTFACAGESDGIANWRTMERRIEALEALGIPAEFHHYPGLPDEKRQYYFARLWRRQRNGLLQSRLFGSSGPIPTVIMAAVWQ